MDAHNEVTSLSLARSVLVSRCSWVSVGIRLIACRLAGPLPRLRPGEAVSKVATEITPSWSSRSGKSTRDAVRPGAKWEMERVPILSHKQVLSVDGPVCRDTA